MPMDSMNERLLKNLPRQATSLSVALSTRSPQCPDHCRLSLQPTAVAPKQVACKGSLSRCPQLWLL